MAKSALRVAIGLAIIAVALALAPWWGSRADLRLIGEFMSYMALAVLWNLLAGYSGLVSVGQQAFVGLGGYALFIGVIWFGLPPLLMLPVAAIAAGLAAAILAPLLFRLEGAYFAVGTWVAAETVALIFAAIPSLGAGAGMSLPAKAVAGIASSREMREMIVYWLMLGMGLGVLGGTYALIRSKAGLALMALRDNPLAAGSLGVDIWTTRFRTYLGVAAATGAVGALIFLQKLRISPDAGFSLNDWTAIVIFIVVIGGIGRIEGAVIGTLVYFILREPLVQYGTVYLIVLGLVGILVMIFSRTGFWGLVERHLGWSLMPTRRRREDSQ
jgi:branched-chain amino acid transport system permease protein